MGSMDIASAEHPVTVLKRKEIGLRTEAPQSCLWRPGNVESEPGRGTLGEMFSGLKLQPGAGEKNNFVLIGTYCQQKKVVDLNS